MADVESGAEGHGVRAFHRCHRELWRELLNVWETGEHVDVERFERGSVIEHGSAVHRSLSAANPDVLGIAAALSVLVLDEAVTVLLVAGVAMVAVGVWFGTRDDRQLAEVPGRGCNVVGVTNER